MNDRYDAGRRRATSTSSSATTSTGSRCTGRCHAPAPQGTTPAQRQRQQARVRRRYGTTSTQHQQRPQQPRGRTAYEPARATRYGRRQRFSASLVDTGSPGRAAAPVPQQAAPSGSRPRCPPAPGAERDVRSGDERDYRTEQFSFVEEPDGDSEDVIDWLKFTESRTERREEAKRRARNRVVALVVTLVLVAVGGVGYLWYAGKLPGTSSAGAGRHHDGRGRPEARRDRRPPAQHQARAAPPRRCSSTTPPPSRAPPSCCPTPSP